MNSSLFTWLRNLKQAYFHSRVHRIVKSIWQWTKRVFSNSWTFVRNQILTVYRNPLRALGRLVKPVLFAGSVLILLYLVFTDDIFIDDTEIQGEAKELGFTGEMLTQQAIAMMPEVVQQRFDDLPKVKTRFLEMYKQEPNNKYEAEQVCNTSINFVFDSSFFLAGHPSVVMSSKTPDQFISSQTISIKRLAFWVREKIHLGQARQLKPVLWNQGERFFIKVYPTPFFTSEHNQSFEKLDDAPRILAGILLDYLSPELLTTELVEKGITSSEKFDFPLYVTNNFLDDKQKELFVLNTFIATQLEWSKTHTDLHDKYIDSEWKNQLLLDEMDFRRYGDNAILAKVFIAGRIVQAECYKAGKSCDISSLQDKYIGKYRKELEHTPPGQILLMMLDIGRGDMIAYRRWLDNLLDQNLLLTTKVRLSNLDLVTFTLAMLLEGRQYDEARKLITSPRVLALVSNQTQNKSAIIFRSMRAELDFQQGAPIEYQQLITENFGGISCAELVTTERVHKLWGSNPKNRDLMPALINIINQSYAHLEKSGLKSFEFYNNWGIVEKEAENYQLAYQKFEQALRFEGDHEWALLNWGYAALAHGELSLAREKFLKSLELGTIPNAVSGLLETLRQQDDGNAFLDNFEKYSEDLSNSYDHADRSAFERAAISFSCHLGRPLKTTILHPGEGIVFNGTIIPRDQFQKETCESKS